MRTYSNSTTARMIDILRYERLPYGPRVRQFKKEQRKILSRTFNM